MPSKYGIGWGLKKTPNCVSYIDGDSIEITFDAVVIRGSHGGGLKRFLLKDVAWLRINDVTLRFEED